MNPLLIWPLRLLALAACGLSIYLWQASLAATGVAGCDFEAFDCNAALGSPWAKWFGMPVAAGGALCYAVALIGSILLGRAGALGAAGWRMLEVAVPMAVGAGLWFTAVQATALDSYCLYCLLTHGCGLAMAALVFALRLQSETQEARPVALGIGLAAVGTSQPRYDSTSSGPPPLGLPTIVGVAMVILLAGGQLLGPKPAKAKPITAELESEYRFDSNEVASNEETLEQEAIEAPVSQPKEPIAPVRLANGERTIKLLGGKLEVDTYAHPILGSPEAPYVVVELMDYACPHCRELHDKLDEAIERFDGKVAVIVMPVPGEILCNPYATKARKKSQGACFAAKLALAVADLAPEQFPAFHDWMLKDDNIPNRTAALIEAQSYVNREDLSVALRDEDKVLADRIQKYIGLSAQLRNFGVRGVPAQIMGDKVHAEKIESVDEIVDLWTETLGLQRPAVELPF